MSVDGGRRQTAAWRTFARTGGWFVETETTTAGRTFALREEAGGLRGEVLFATISSLVQVKLQDFRQIIRIREQPGISGNASLESSRLVVHITAKELTTMQAVSITCSGL